MKKTKEILWKSIRDIETGIAKTTTENGLIKSKIVKLTKKNVCHQSSKYNNGKEISRPTLDNYEEISNYIMSTKKSCVQTELAKAKLAIEALKIENELLKKSNIELRKKEMSFKKSLFQF